MSLDFAALFALARPYAEQMIAERFGATIHGDPLGDLLTGPRCPSYFNRATVDNAIRHEQHAIASLAACSRRSIEKIAGMALSARPIVAVKARIADKLDVAA